MCANVWILDSSESIANNLQKFWNSVSLEVNEVCTENLDYIVNVFAFD